MVMHDFLSRRRFLTMTGAGLAGLAAGPDRLAAVQPFARPGKARLQLSLAAYSFREFFIHGREERPDGKPPHRDLKLSEFIDYCAEHGCVGTELTSYFFPKKVRRSYLLQLRRQAFLRGIAISGTAVGNTFTHPKGIKRDEQMSHVKRWITYAQMMGAPHIRVFAGNQQPGSDAKEARRLCIEALEEAAEYAGNRAIFLGVENHGGITAEAKDLLEIVEAVKSPWVGINLDTGNFHTDDPYGDLERCAPYAVNVQVKVDMKPRGKPGAPADLPRLVKMLKEANYQGFVTLEYESVEDPFKAVPDYLKKLQDLIEG